MIGARECAEARGRKLRVREKERLKIFEVVVTLGWGCGFVQVIPFCGEIISMRINHMFASVSTIIYDTRQKISHCLLLHFALYTQPQSSKRSDKNVAKQVVSVTQAASQAGKIANNLEGRVLALRTEAKRIDAAEIERRARSLQFVSSKENFSALIKAGRTTIQIEGDDFAVTHG